MVKPFQNETQIYVRFFSSFKISKLGKEASFPQLSHKLKTTAELENELPDPDSRFGNL